MELDAVPPNLLIELVEDAIRRNIDAEAWEKEQGGPVFNYMIRDGVAPRISSYWYFIGLVRDDWTRKPAFGVMQQAAAP